MQRRSILRAALGGAGFLLLDAVPPVAAFAQGVPSGTLQATELRPGLLQLRGAGGNIVLSQAASGVVMVDSGAPEHAEAVARFVAERFDRAPIVALLNTHWHLEHTGGNEAVSGGRTKIVAHENTRLWMATQFYVDWQDRTYEPRPAAARPTETFFSHQRQPIVLSDAGQRVEYALLREAHTDGDIYVRFPDHNVIVAGGAVTVDEYPVLDYATGGALGGLIDATRTLIDMSDTETLIVPATGPAVRRAHLEAQHDMLSKIRERMQSLARQGKSVAEMLAAGITNEFDSRWGKNSELFVRNVYASIWGISG